MQLIFIIEAHKAFAVFNCKAGDHPLLIASHDLSKSDVCLCTGGRGQVITAAHMDRLSAFECCQFFQLACLQRISTTIQTARQMIHIHMGGLVPTLCCRVPRHQRATLERNFTPLPKIDTARQCFQLKVWHPSVDDFEHHVSKVPLR